jgi:hypothetical protein
MIRPLAGTHASTPRSPAWDGPGGTSAPRLSAAPSLAGEPGPGEHFLGQCLHREDLRHGPEDISVVQHRLSGCLLQQGRPASWAAGGPMAASTGAVRARPIRGPVPRHQPGLRHPVVLCSEQLAGQGGKRGRPPRVRFSAPSSPPRRSEQAGVDTPRPEQAAPGQPDALTPAGSDRGRTLMPLANQPVRHQLADPNQQPARRTGP